MPCGPGEPLRVLRIDGVTRQQCAAGYSPLDKRHSEAASNSPSNDGGEREDVTLVGMGSAPSWRAASASQGRACPAAVAWSLMLMGDPTLSHALRQVALWESQALIQAALGVALVAAARVMPVRFPRSQHPGATGEVFVFGRWLLQGPSAADGGVGLWRSGPCMATAAAVALPGRLDNGGRAAPG